MTLTLDLGPALYSLGRYILFVGVLAYLVREWWILDASTKGRR